MLSLSLVEAVRGTLLSAHHPFVCGEIEQILLSCVNGMSLFLLSFNMLLTSNLFVRVTIGIGDVIHR